MFNTYLGHMVKRFDKDDFKDLVVLLYEENAMETPPEDDDFTYAVAGQVQMGYVQLPVIFVNSVMFDDLSLEWKEAIMTHECAHCEGIIDEEEADLWAMDRISNESQKVLKTLWMERHGHEYQS